MSRLRLLIVDDERPAREKVARLVAADARFEVVGQAGDGIAALQQIEARLPDVVVLDVTMPGIGGFEVLEALGDAREFDVVFCTASDAHAIRAFEENAIDYLLKPYDQARMQRALDRVHARTVTGASHAGLDALLSARQGAEAARLTVRTDAGWVALRTDVITRLSAADKYVLIACEGAQHAVRGSLRSLSNRLDPQRFVRVHRSHVVNVHAVERLEPWSHGDALLVLAGGESIVLSRNFRRAFLQRFGRPPAHG